MGGREKEREGDRDRQGWAERQRQTGTDRKTDMYLPREPEPP